MMIRPRVVRGIDRARRGAVMVLVMLAVSVSFIIGLTFLASSTTVTDISRTLDHHSQARQIAESGLGMATHYVEATSDWREVRTPGQWMTDQELFDGTVTVEAEFNASSVASPVTVDDFSFEQVAEQLATPLIAPPMSGTIGGWELTRTAALETGLTVPHMGVEASADATDGSHVAFARFTVSVDGTAVFGQSLGTTLKPYRMYEVVADVATSGLPLLDTRYGFRVLAGNEVIASTEHAATLMLPSLPGIDPVPPGEEPTLPELESVLNALLLADGFVEYTLQFVTDGSPQIGELRLELYAESTGLLCEVCFDNVRFREVTYEPLQLTATGRHGDASHVVKITLQALPAPLGGSFVEPIAWSEN